MQTVEDQDNRVKTDLNSSRKKHYCTPFFNSKS